MTSEQVIPLATVLAALGIWLMLPRGAAGGRAAGVVLAAVGGGLWASQLPGLGDWASSSLFFLLAAVTVIAAVATITFRSPIYSAIWFGLTLVGTAGLFLIIGAEFLAVATLVVYAGAILVTFLFALMLAQPEGQAPYDRRSWEAMLSAATGMVIVGILSMTIGRAVSALPSSEAAVEVEKQMAQNILTPDHVARLGAELFGRHLVAIEVAGTLLLAALVGAAVIVAQGRLHHDRGPKP
jgi:NADH-quinone oxidoreductase subunit J